MGLLNLKPQQAAALLPLGSDGHFAVKDVHLPLLDANAQDATG